LQDENKALVHRLDELSRRARAVVDHFTEDELQACSGGAYYAWHDLRAYLAEQEAHDADA
jgi:hypothetical protein